MAYSGAENVSGTCASLTGFHFTIALCAICARSAGTRCEAAAGCLARERGSAGRAETAGLDADTTGHRSPAPASATSWISARSAGGSGAPGTGVRATPLSSIRTARAFRLPVYGGIRCSPASTRGAVCWRPWSRICSLRSKRWRSRSGRRTGSEDAVRLRSRIIVCCDARGPPAACACRIFR